MPQAPLIASPCRTESAPPATSVARLLWVVGAVTFLEFLETGMVTFATGPLIAGLGLRPEEFSLAFTAYGVAAIVMLYKHQWVVERIGYRRFVLLSLLGFALGAILCATATGLHQFLLGRAVQGLAGATFFTGGRMQMNRLPENQRFRGLLVFIGSLLGATAISPLVAAACLSLGGWPALFWLVPPLAALVAWTVGPHLSPDLTAPAERSEEHWGWLLWMVLGVIGLQYAIQAAQFQLLDRPGLVVLLGGGSALALTLFAARQWRQERPLINYRSLFQLRYLVGISLYFCGYFLIGAMGFLLPILLQQGHGLGLFVTAGLLSLSMGAGVFAALLHAMLARRWPRFRRYMLSGLLLLAVAVLLLASSGPAATAGKLVLPALLGGFALPLYMGPVAFGTFTAIPARVFSHAYQVKNIIRQLGLSSAMVVCTLLLQWRYGHHLPAGLNAADSGLPGQPSQDWAAHLLQGQVAGVDLMHHSAALVAACADVFLGGLGLLLTLAVVVSLQRVLR